MRFSLMLMIRLIALGGLGSSVVAIGLSRANPRATHSHAVTAPRYFGISGSLLTPGGDRDFLLDAETGRVREADFGPGVLFKYVVSAPSRDETGRHLLLGQLSFLTGTGSAKLITVASLAVLGLDGGVSHELPALESVVTGFPCWLPGHPDRVLVPAGDSQLYVQELPPRETLGKSGAGPERRPRPIDWRCKTPGDGAVVITDPASIPDPSRGDYIAVSLATIRKTANARPRFAPLQLWWLKLDPLDQSILDAGMITPPSASGCEERLPSFAVLPGGTPCIAYLSSCPATQVWRLMLAPVSFDGPNGSPKVHAEQIREVSEDVAAMPPVFSPDGRWLHEIRRELAASEMVSRIDVTRVIAQSPDDGGR